MLWSRGRCRSHLRSIDRAEQWTKFEPRRAQNEGEDSEESEDDGVVLDAVASVEARVSEAATLLSVTTGNLVDFLEQDPKVWQQANVLRQQFGQKPLKA